MDRREWPEELWMARVDDSPSWYVSCCDTPRQPTDRRYVLLPDDVRDVLREVLMSAHVAIDEGFDCDKEIAIFEAWLDKIGATEPAP